ncbi:unnamed protein product [Rotaria magnacalcarata]|uniref:Solute carrier family 12 member 9 n=1 Tax=Rotaria magnacalcarata TaxID=392030 RepID=A0A816WQW1_9BILA|nr:unnamed protein product [Rotaria magnacalcarata]CAF1512457.1 unnamed protein product [Rotaria magnacalcarata]CAF1914861.1 unnamed protein product [Rotaria magnacalcarata]CAF2137378.1 unnamed protein product [Rotaria magnacalcarata]CAF2137829.1 unnamed protein product [Rotaria magnacalcarata]
MNGFSRIRSTLRRTIFSSNGADTSPNTARREDFPILSRHLSSYERFDLSTGSQGASTASLQNINSINNSLPHAPVIETTNEGVEFLSHNSKRTLRTIPGVFCPIALSMFSISLFMRIGFVVAHAGVLQTLLQLGLCFLILFCTLLSVCSLATNGAIEGGGVYHMISRALGPEFGGSIGVLFFFANVIGNGQSVAALVEALVDSFGPGSKASAFQDSHWWRFLYGTIINIISLITCLLGSSLFSMATFFIFILVSFVYLMVVVSFFVKGPQDVIIPKVNAYAYEHPPYAINASDFLYGHYTGFSAATFRENTYANYTIDYTTGDVMNFATVFGVLFSSITGLLAGANMSGELKRPSRSIPTGSIAAVLFVFFIFITETLLMAATTDRYTLTNNYLFLQDVNIWAPFVIIGIIAAVFSACLSGLIGASRILEALAVDEIFGSVLSWIRAGTTRHGNPWAAVIFTFILVQLTLFIGSMNTIAPIVTIFFLLAYFAVNLSCLALDLASAPNFRPTFKYFSWHTALLGAVGSIIMCFIVSAAYASIAIGILIGFICMLHLRDFPRASWGSISQALIFHQVRKYLLLLDPRKEHVKFWRPQMLLLVANPRSSINLIDFVNDMKKGGLFILGHVKTGQMDTGAADLCSQEYPYWVSLIDNMKIKAFVDMTLAPTIRDGVLQLMRLSGLGGLRPNTVILGFYDGALPEDKLRNRSFFKRRWLKSSTPVNPMAAPVSHQQPIIQSGAMEGASTITLHSFNSSAAINGNDMFPIFNFGELRQEDEDKELDVYSYVQIIKDALNLNKSICLARNFHQLQKDDIEVNKRKVFVDIWPVNFIFPETSTQFDVTCLYMLQLATILSMVKPWKSRATLRVFLCIDAINDNALRTQQHLDELLSQLRINAQTRMIAWENVTSLLNNTSTINDSAATIPVEQQATTTGIAAAITNSFIDINDVYIRGVNELIRQQCDSTSCLYLYLPRPPKDKSLSPRYMRVLDLLSHDLPPVMFVHGVSSVTCTQL